jgi:hypothetical protein
MADQTIAEITQRMAAVEQRLETHAAGPAPDGLTDPDPETPEERWQAAQVWGHLAEFMPYWLGQIQMVISEFGGEPVPFGRTKADAARLEGIAGGLGTPIADQMASVREAIANARNYLDGLTPEQWAAIGLHSRRGEMNIPDIVQTFMLNHLEEHAAQLDALV